MSTYNPPTLQQLALDALLRKDAIDSFDLDHLPTMRFPPLFLEAFSGRHTQILKAMVAAWPFSYLPVWGKLHVLDLRDVHQDFWDVWTGREEGIHSAEIGSEMRVAEQVPRKALRQDLKVLTDLSLCCSLNGYRTCLLQHAQQRKGSLCLRVFLESLSITHCSLSESDLKYLSQCNWICQLKHRHIKYAELSMSRFTHLQILLEKVADSLQTLELENYRKKDSQLSVVLSALSQCSQLTLVNCYDNHFSSPVLKDLLQCIANLSKMTVERYPAPLECYNDLGAVVVERFSQLYPDLMDILMAKRQLKTIFFAMAHCPHCWAQCL
ncbi:oogenesin-1-like [Apodemus sylvaticus]|uniref:oogenesin-1-like n=1 Tax=Apodemus sylvaticus TaxID=10129 RepID=UPI002242F147|nr:oogenesin-1-like [Apodemus sylvaticus]